MPKSSKHSQQLPQKAETFRGAFAAAKQKAHAYKDTRVHRSFKRTKRRDALRPYAIPGYISFTVEVWKTLWQYKRTFLLLIVFYAVLTAGLVGLASQSTYQTVADELSATASEVLGGDLGKLSQAGLLFLSAAGGSFTEPLTEAQQLFAAFLVILVWMSTVWLLRNLLAGHKVRLRDGLYNAHAPLIPSIMIVLVILVQLLPLALALFGYTAAVSSGLLGSGGIEAMLFWVIAGILGVVSLYWITSSAFALVVVTVPGVYPLKAMRAASDLVFGRRVQLLLRVLWLLVTAAIAWLVILVPTIAIDLWIKSLWPAIQWLPIIPVLLLLLGAITAVWVSAYIYLLYRKVIADEQ